MWERRVACSVLVGKPKGRIPRGRVRRRWKDGIKTNIHKFIWEGMGLVNPN